ncbi:hypothetical protein C4D60_Mb07t07350 [Musa balbisiana]|uniref:Uncharacterized protein n=1 Tax=Musa balbisiana TaxID=52838 RepID=A0A4S8JDT5_MUSBA|nr:hypothetical protein C4D60_Mb07t07350 [Musa balbisiana]
MFNKMVPALSPSIPKLHNSLEWNVIQKKVGPVLWLLVISTIFILFIMHSSYTLSISAKGGLSQSPLMSAANSSVIQLVQSPPDPELLSPNLSAPQPATAATISRVTPVVEGLHPNTSGIEELCDMTKGKWVTEPRASIYTNVTCPTLPDMKNCGKYGKDQSYLYWRWQPDSCDIPRFDPVTFLNLVRGKKMAFIGDSLARNQMESLLCLLSQVEKQNKVRTVHANLSQAETSRQVFRDSGDKYVTWYFPTHEFTLMAMWTEYFVEARPRIINGTASSSFELQLDRVTMNWTEKLPGVDYAILSGGNWFFRGLHLYRGGEIVGCVNCWGQNLTDFGVAAAIRSVLRTALQFIATCKECEGLVTILRTFTPSHFENGSWFSGGQCNRTQPLNESQISLSDITWEIRKVQLEEIERARRQEGEVNIKFEVLDVTKAMMLRADSHPGKHWTTKTKGGVNDCLHWCLPGPVDLWSDLLLATLKKNSLSH